MSICINPIQTGLTAKIEEVKTNLEPIERLWNTVKLFQDKRHYWKDTKLAEINAEEEEKASDEMYRTGQCYV
jgi:hypothetical protein